MSGRHEATQSRDAVDMAATPAPKRRRWLPKKVHGWQVLLVFVAIIGVAALINGGFGNGKSDHTPAEQSFLDDQRSTLDDDQALRYGQAACDLLDSGGQQMTVEWLAGTDDFSRAGYVRPNPDPISMYDARQIVESAGAYLC